MDLTESAAMAGSVILKGLVEVGGNGGGGKDAPAAEIVAEGESGVDGAGADVFEIIAYRAYCCAFFCTGCFGIIAGDVLVGVSQIRLHIRAAPMVFTRRLPSIRASRRGLYCMVRLSEKIG